MATKKKARKSPTLAQARAIYEGGRRAYSNSYAMMVDDILSGMKAPAKKARVQVFCDVDWFHEMGKHIRAHRRWESLTDEQHQDIHEALKRG